MSLSKIQASAQSTTNRNANQAVIDTNYMSQADLVIGNAVAIGQFKCTLTLTKGVSATNLSNYYSGMGYKTLVGLADNYGYDSNTLNNPATGIDTNSLQLDQPVSLFGFYWSLYWNGDLTNTIICDGVTPLYLYLSWY